MRTMSNKRLKDILHKHKLSLHRKKGGERAVIEGEHIRDINLTGAILRQVKFWDCDIRNSCFEKADLTGAKFYNCRVEDVEFGEAKLVGTIVSSSYVKWCGFEESNMQSAFIGNCIEECNFVGADLRKSYFSGVADCCDFKSSDMIGTNLSDVLSVRDSLFDGAKMEGCSFPSPTVMLLAKWKGLSSETIYHLMRLDCSAHPDGKKAFNRWRREGTCPYRDIGIKRAATFPECAFFWEYGPPPTIWEAFKMIMDEKCPGWSLE